jgi:hypothetical protein
LVFSSTAFVAPLDGREVLAVDIQSGTVLWRQPQPALTSEGRLRVAGSIEGELLVWDGLRIEGRDLRTGAVNWEKNVEPCTAEGQHRACSTLAGAMASGFLGESRSVRMPCGSRLVQQGCVVFRVEQNGIEKLSPGARERSDAH